MEAWVWCVGAWGWCVGIMNAMGGCPVGCTKTSPTCVIKGVSVGEREDCACMCVRDSV